ncbi:MAG: c-type cytochrome [Hyphomicrobiales bacterium]|nr:c-type cytochrome [Hyphomicrobiales bacterium]
MPPRAPVVRLVFAAALFASGAQAADVDYQRAVHPRPMSHTQMKAREADLTELGRQIFFDPSLSGSGAMSCSSCHDPAYGYGPKPGGVIALGGPRLDQPGVRAVPSLRYLRERPDFTEHFMERDDDGEIEDAGPTGGLTWDGRFDRAQDQNLVPLLSPIEMANPSPEAVVAKLEKAPYADRFREIFGASVFENRADAFAAALDALAAFERSPADFTPYTSRYDAWLAEKIELTPQELRGLRLFMNENKGNCGTCHPGETTGLDTPPQFSDWGFVALGVPRNAEIPANADPAHIDLGLCGPDRTDFTDRSDYCGRFRTPSLRNVAVRAGHFHNGVFNTLREAVAFYATRDTDPGRWYPKRADGTVAKFDDLPEAYHDNVETGAPFGRRPGDAPALTDAEIDDVVAFLKTLTDADLTPRP